MDRIPKIFKNFYFIAGLVFVIWMIFLDNNDLISQLRLSSKYNDLLKEKEYYQEKIKEVEVDRQGLLSDDELLEKFARERYLMKKENEELFIIVQKD
ncbi:septum formation initiator family protein [Marivirga sp. S37H4]|uniref:Septum formation initiator family protein n=1 Tax=Marivirga aurantiaca TaxID=2802615 RepID=A0A934X1G9_9BACT|nr:septum formation initiator family protein [Marivirga aurantiaca]MBK6267243.1 septum formation initiator family protein [Marivirga aurantiaca]